MRRALTLLLAPLLLLAACGDDKADDDASDKPAATALDALDAVEVSGKSGEKPTIEFEQPFSVDETSRKVLTEGDGEELVDGATAELHFLIINGRDGSELDSSYGNDPAIITVSDSLLTGIKTGLQGAKVGSRILIAITPEDGFGPQGGDPERKLEADDTMLMFVEILDVRIPLERAEGEAVEPVEGLPTVTLDDTGAPTITVPEGEVAPAELVAQELIKGEGAVVEAGQTLTVHYTGILFDTGEVFDSSWESGTPASFPIGTGGVIPGWDEGLVGRTIGSQVLLVIPPDKGYGDTGSGATIPPGATLVFVVDILDAS
jgi:peptidylprolyl isomerase